MRLDLGRRATGAFDERFHGIDVFLDAAGPRLSVDIYENIVGVVTGEGSLPVGLVPPCEIELIHTPEVAVHLVVHHQWGLLLGSLFHAETFALARDLIEHDDVGRLRPRWASISSEAIAELPVDSAIPMLLRRMWDNVDDDPDVAIGAAQELVERLPSSC
jgi:hypothetical protein